MSYSQGGQQDPRFTQPQAQKKRGPGCLKIVGVLVLALVVLGALGRCAGSGSQTASPAGSAPPQAATQEATTNAPATSEALQPAEQVSASTLIDTLESNALKAETTYKGKRLEVTGYVDNIDAQGKYFTVIGQPDEFVLTGVQAFIKPEHRAAVADFNKGDKVTFVGKVTQVGEVFGYGIQVESIK